MTNLRFNIYMYIYIHAFTPQSLLSTILKLIFSIRLLNLGKMIGIKLAKIKYIIRKIQ